MGRERDPRFFVDAENMALGKALALARGDVIHPNHPALPEVRTETHDHVWLPIVAERQLLVITRDKKIRRRPIELRAWRDNGVRGFVLTGAGQLSTWDVLRILTRNWDYMETVADERPLGPWMIAITNGQPREINLG